MSHATWLWWFMAYLGNIDYAHYMTYTKCFIRVVTFKFTVIFPGLIMTLLESLMTSPNK